MQLAIDEAGAILLLSLKLDEALIAVDLGLKLAESLREPLGCV